MPLILTPGHLSNRGEFYYQLGAQIEAGISIIPALRNHLRSPIAKSFRRPIENLILYLEEGAPLAESMEALNGFLPEFDLALIRAGEESGTLDAVFRVLAEYYRERAQLSKSIIGNLIYPIAVLHMGILVFPPQTLVKVIEGDVGPWIMQKLMIFIPLYLVSFFVLVVTQREGGHSWSSLMEKIFHVVPLLGAARRNLAFSRLTLALESLINAGVGIVQAWPLAARACGSPAIERAVKKSMPLMEDGHMPADVIQKQPIFPSYFTGLYQTGEASGRMDHMLSRMHAHYHEEGFRKMKHFSFWAPNALFGAIAIFVAIFIVRFYMAYFKNISDAMQ
ncbi:MAG: type II secretion system F family protein [Verrucomicrobiia bacterium]|jgi:type II secretory pathway component PulF